MGAEHTTYTAADTGDVILMMGGLPLSDPTVLIAASLPGDLFCDVAWMTGEANVRADVARRWPTLLVSVTAAVLDGSHGVLEVLYPDGIPDGSLAAQIIETMNRNLESAREMEAAMAETDE
jgi:hypothetical protein